ncbi:heparan-alpha-glucosaminide N-acetyltransferase [Andreprevotia chitinilytica]|uniref:heparan-alpha-glucosaminide N-acetyltransferase n=1 Tax=Andreprevotia chitinilytica TaxID=396808 RepID=UPI00055591F2|nr:heparan-alpha-glucosaminide N-acetyltransferase [Andreprevotia chitinilytica]
MKKTPPSSPRFAIIDAARGFAVCMMIAYHFCYDTTYFGITHFRFLVDQGWIVWRTVIVTSFLLLVGLSLVLAQNQSRRGFTKRWLQIAGAALLVTAASLQLFPNAYIYFGILHFNALAALIGLACLRLTRNALLALCAAALAVGLSVQLTAFDPKWINWIGLVANKPLTEDYVPLLPWIGVVFLGMAVGMAWRERDYRLVSGLAKAGDAAPRWLRWLGRHSLAAYLLHQPILFGGFYLAGFGR